MSVIFTLRRYLWKILGIDYSHILKVIDYTYLKEDNYTTIGYKSYSNNALVFRWSKSPILIGKYCSIANGVRIIVDMGNHDPNVVSSYPFNLELRSLPQSRSGITIGNDVWIGQNSIILPGIKIGNGVIIAAGSVVTHDIPDYCVVGGVPAKIIKHKCNDFEKKKLNDIKWWDWPPEKVLNNINDFKLTIPEFISKHYNQF